MKKVQSGFTLIELVVVIVILGILGVTAVPRFIDLADDAETAAVQGVAAALTSASAINYAQCKADDASADCTAVTDCTDVGPLLQGGLPNDSNGSPYVITAGTAVGLDTSVVCEVTDSTTTYSANFTAIGT